MHFDSDTVKLWPDFQKAPHIEVRFLLEDGACSDLSVNGAALI